MSNLQHRESGVPSDDSSVSSPLLDNNTDQHEWRFDVDFRLNSNWLPSPRATDSAPLPPPISILNDWLRNLNRPAAAPPTESSGGSFTPLEADIHTESSPGTDESRTFHLPNHRVQTSLESRACRRSQGTYSALEIEQENNGESSPLSTMTSSGRSSGQIVIDVTENESGRRASSDLPAHSPNERQDEASPTDRLPVEASTFFSLAERYFPFLLIILFKVILDHAGGLAIFLGLVATFSHANTVVRREVTKQSKRSLPLLLMVVTNLLICILCLYYIFEADRLYPALICLPIGIPLSTLQSVLWIVLVTDFVAKFITVIGKCLVLMLPEEVVLFQRRGKHYMFIESTSQLYRCALPILPWLQYLFGAYEGTFKIFSLFLCLFYVICKAIDLSQRFLAWKIALTKFIQPVHYGSVPSVDEINEQFCPICHDGYTCPTKLSCGHIFCEDCVSNWLDRGECNCPMCRARVVDDTSWRNGATSQFVYTF